jgi:hypothetical protein
LPGIGAPDAIGWSDLDVPPFCIASPEDARRLAAFEDEVIDRLFVLNEQRAREEAALGRTGKAAKGAKAAKKPPAARRPKATSPAEVETDRPKGKKKRKPPEGQGSLGIG